jgi:hypothetical protein
MDKAEKKEIEFILRGDRKEMAKKLLKRARVSADFIEWLSSGYDLHIALEVISHLIDDIPPDVEWLRDYYLINGDRMVLTEEGWIPAEMNTKAYTGSEPCEVLDEVNSPTSTPEQNKPRPCRPLPKRKRERTKIAR